MCRVSSDRPLDYVQSGRTKSSLTGHACHLSQIDCLIELDSFHPDLTVDLSGIKYYWEKRGQFISLPGRW